VIIISNNPHNRNTPDFLAVHITTRKEHPYAINLSQADFVSGGLEDESIVRFDTVTRYEEKLLLKKIGKVTPEFYKKVHEKIVELIRLGAES
jgi:mRNA-degrading endonuclease toxin of MazEF toxin-antitoxin module